MLPSSLLHFTDKKKYNLRNDYSSYINTIEDSLRALSILLPGKKTRTIAIFYTICLRNIKGRFEDSDLCSQASNYKIGIEM
jgi:peroxin-16